ncbi:MAG: hypothetical protein ABSB38_02630 [Dehalococcoidia bacterium]
MVTCTICKKEFKNTQGLAGHNQFVHSNNGDRSKEPAAQLAEQSPGFSLGFPPPAQHGLGGLEQRLARLEQAIGLRDSDLDVQSGYTEVPLTRRLASVSERAAEQAEQVAELTQQLSQFSEQLGKLTEQLESGYVSREALGTMVAELTGKFKSLQNETSNTYKMLAAGIHENGESCKDHLSKIEGKATATANELYELSTTVNHIRESVRSDRTSINQVNTKLVSLEHMLSELENKVAEVKQLTRRVPTGETVGIELSDKREHHFREYKSSEGLAHPHRSKQDLMLGDRWVDLAEPED